LPLRLNRRLHFLSKTRRICVANAFYAFSLNKTFFSHKSSLPADSSSGFI
jgi:hypothetical protein